MINFSLHLFYWDLKILHSHAKTCAERNPDAPRKAGDLSESFLKRASKLADDLGLKATKHRIETIRLQLEYDEPTQGDMANAWKVLIETIEGDIKDECFYHYPPEKAARLLSFDNDWESVIQAFPGSADDARSAVDCYALGHHRASIHHCMMVLEFGLPALARRLKVSFNPDKATWAPIIKDIRTEITNRRAALGTHPRGSPPPKRAVAKKAGEFLEACEEAAQEFSYFTTVWRNHIAHGRGEYDENDAKKVLEHVRTFMEVIASRLKLKEKP